jgi:glycosyltransferase involved in cell wall biosynthesis
MHVGLLVYGSLETLSGGYLYDRKLVGFLRCQGDRVTVVARPWRDYPRHLADNLSPAWERRLAGLDVDVLVQDELCHPSLAWVNPRLKRRAGYPLVSLVHHLRCSEPRPAWLNRLYRAVEARYLRGVDGFIYNSQTTRGVVERLAGAGKPSVVATPAGDRLRPGVSPAEIEARARQPGPLRALFLGNLIPRKGLHVLLEAVRRLPAGTLEVTVVGSPTMAPGYARRLRRRAADLEAAGRVRFLGPLDDAPLAGRLRSHQVLVVPSAYEGFGIVYLESMGFGLPAVAGDRGAAAEIVTPGETGCLVPPDDPAALAACLEGLAGDRSRLARLGRAALQCYRAHPGWEQSMSRARNFLQELTA